MQTAVDIDQIADALAPLIEPARPWIRRFAGENRYADLAGWNELIDRLTQQLGKQPDLWQVDSHVLLLGNATTGLMASNLASRLLQIAVERGPEPAAHWLAKLLSGALAQSFFAAHVSGVHVDQKVNLSPELTLLPFAELPDSDAKRKVQRSAQWDMGSLRFSMPPDLTTAAIYRLPAWPFKAPHQEASDAMSAVMDATRDFERQIATLTAVDDCAPLIETYWHEFDDPDFEAGRHGTGFMQPGREGRSPYQGINITAEASTLLSQRLALPADQRRVLDLALTRLNQSSRRMWVGDRAIDVSICLEALLCKATEESGMTQALKERAAFVLGGDEAAQAEVRRAVGKLYRVRGKVVHGRAGREDLRAKETTAVKDGIDLARRVVRSLLDRGEIPDWPALAEAQDDAAEDDAEN